MIIYFDCQTQIDMTVLDYNIDPFPRQRSKPRLSNMFSIVAGYLGVHRWESSRYHSDRILQCGNLITRIPSFYKHHCVLKPYVCESIHFVCGFKGPVFVGLPLPRMATPLPGRRAPQAARATLRSEVSRAWHGMAREEVVDPRNTQNKDESILGSEVNRY